jgi:hypothetical protein
MKIGYYMRPEILSLDTISLEEANGPCYTQYGTLNVDMYRAQLEKPCEYRYAENIHVNTEVKNA